MRIERSAGEATHPLIDKDVDRGEWVRSHRRKDEEGREGKILRKRERI